MGENGSFRRFTSVKIALRQQHMFNFSELHSSNGNYSCSAEVHCSSATIGPVGHREAPSSRTQRTTNTHRGAGGGGRESYPHTHPAPQPLSRPLPITQSLYPLPTTQYGVRSRSHRHTADRVPLPRPTAHRAQRPACYHHISYPIYHIPN